MLNRLSEMKLEVLEMNLIMLNSVSGMETVVDYVLKILLCS